MSRFRTIAFMDGPYFVKVNVHPSLEIFILKGIGLNFLLHIWNLNLVLRCPQKSLSSQYIRFLSNFFLTNAVYLPCRQVEGKVKSMLFHLLISSVTLITEPVFLAKKPPEKGVEPIIYPALSSFSSLEQDPLFCLVGILSPAFRESGGH